MKIFKNKTIVAAAAALTMGLTASFAQAAAHPAERSEQNNLEKNEDFFNPDLYFPFRTAACTADGYTIAGKIEVLPSVSDLERMVMEEDKDITPDMLQAYIDEAWHNTVSTLQSSEFGETIPESFHTALEEHVIKQMVDDIEEDTGLSTEIYDVRLSRPSPGCF